MLHRHQTYYPCLWLEQMTAPLAKTVSVTEFLRSRCLGPVSAGVSMAEVVALWGQPTEAHLSRPPAYSYGPVWLFVRDKKVTHAGVYATLSMSPGPPGFAFDVAVDSEEAFRRSISSAGLHCSRADDLMRDGEPEVVLRIEESGVEVVFDENGRLSCLAEPIPEGI